MQGSVSVKGRACGLVLAGQGVGGCGGEVGRGTGESGTITIHIIQAPHPQPSPARNRLPRLQPTHPLAQHPTTAVHLPPTDPPDLNTTSRPETQTKALWGPRSPRLLPRLPCATEHPDMLSCG